MLGHQGASNRANKNEIKNRQRVFRMIASALSVRSQTLVLTGCLVLNACLASPGVGQTQTVRVGDYQFTIPMGMRIEPVTTEELTTWPIVVDWDQQGRLLVVESGGVSKPIVEHNKQLLHRVVRLDDQNQDGIFDKRTVVAKDLPFMEGVLCIGNDLLVSAPPNIYRLIDADGDGVCEDRQIWFDGQTITGCANDLHGPYMGRDGWIYWCKGAFAEQQHDLLNGQRLKTTAAHIFRRRLSGGAIEPVMTGGMDNPVEVASIPEGERFFTSTFLHNPGNGLRDGVAHAVYGGVHGKQQGVLDGHVRTGELMPVLVDLGGAAPSGLICLDSPRLFDTQPSEARVLVAALFNLQKVTAHRLTPSGATFHSHNQDLVVADRVDFHPTDIIEDADGSLLIVDTGGWYNLCCPSSRVDQKTAAGGIYRLTKGEHASLVADNRAASRSRSFDATRPATPESMVQGLHDSRPWVARHAQLQLLGLPSEQGASVVAQLANQVNDSSRSIDERLKSLWGLSSLGSPAALSAITEQLVHAGQATSPAAPLLQAACHIVSLHRFTPAREPLEQLLLHTSPQVRRVAAEALGRVGDVDSAGKLLASLQAGVDDRHWQHSVTYALIELGATDVAVKWLASTKTEDTTAAQNMVALMVIDQLRAAEQLTPNMLLDGLKSTHDNYRRTASQILARNPQWAANYRAPIDELFMQVSSDRLPAIPATPLITIVQGWRETQTVQSLMTQWLSSAVGSAPAKQQLLQQLLSTYADYPIPADWSEPLAQWLRQSDPASQLQLAEVLARVNFAQAEQVIEQLLEQAKTASASERKIRFLAALPTGVSCQDRQLEQTVLDSLRADATDATDLNVPSEASVNLQSLAMQTLQRVKLSLVSGQMLLASLQDYPPRVLPIVIEAINRIGDDQLDANLLGKLVSVPAARTLSEEQVLNLFRSRSPALRAAAAQTVENLSRPPSDIEQHVDKVLGQLVPGDPIRGLQLFRSNKTACSGCHRLGYVGGEIGPNLTKIGSTRTRRALLEAILFPSSRLEQSYQPTKILTHDGQVYNGLITKHLSPEQFELQLTADKSLVLSTDDVAQQEASQVSIMPSGVADLLTIEELSDLMAILESAK
jgi:putative membrane-bound dehydrogenase-like protein